MVAEPLGDVPDADRIRTKRLALDLRPGDRHGDWRSAFGSDRVRGDRRLRIGVAVDDEEETPFASLFGELGRQVLGVIGRQALGDRVGKAVDLLESGTDGDRRDY